MNWAGDLIQENIEETDTVLDLGCGIMQATLDFIPTYPNTRLKCKKLFGVDIHQPYLDFLNDLGIETLKWDLRDVPLPFEDKSYDNVILTDILEHLPHIEYVNKLIRESKRIARKKIIVLTPRKFTNNIKSINCPYPYKQNIEKNEFQRHHILIKKKYLKKNGFEVYRIGTSGKYLFGILKKCGDNKMSREMWNQKYIDGKVQVKAGLFENITRWVWDIINKYAEDDIKKECIDVGCGNLSFWRTKIFFLRPCKKYIGIDISDVIITKNVKKYFHKNKRFIYSSSGLYLDGLISKVVLCIDLLFHLLDDEEYVNTIINLCKYSSKWIILSNWYREPEDYDKDYQKYRDFNEYQYIFKEYGFKLIRICFVPNNEIGAIYVYKKVDENEC